MPQEFKEGQVWAHRYGGIPEMNAHFLVENIDGVLTLRSAYNIIKCSEVELPSPILFFCGEYDEIYFEPKFIKEFKEAGKTWIKH